VAVIWPTIILSCVRLLNKHEYNSYSRPETIRLETYFRVTLIEAFILLVNSEVAEIPNTRGVGRQECSRLGCISCRIISLITWK
jgi:hypothetical protein